MSFFRLSDDRVGAAMKGWASSLWLFPTLLANMEKVDELSPHY
jgi:hypothetical protein